MSQHLPRNILISEPQGVTGELQFDNSKPYVPYMWAILKTFWERHGDASDAFRWLDPIWWNDRPEVVLAPYDGQCIDVLGLSCYTWNWDVQCLIAAAVKERNPHCLVVAGGPEPDYKDSELFHRHRYLDVVAVKDGEITFRNILSGLARGELDLTRIPGLYLPQADGAGHLFTGPAEVPTVFEYSPYVAQSEYYERLLQTYRHMSFDVIFETNRGCPYGCSFCDWGSSTMSKVRRFDMQRIEEEIDWLGRMRINRVMLADANFGILPRDVEIADLLNESRARHNGYPQFIFYSAAKNNPVRTTEIAMKFAKSGICTIHALSIQHTKKEVLAATNRSNISPDKQVEVVKAMMAARVPVEVQLILGIPGDTYALWKGCLADLMEWGIHEDYLIQAYRLLPNAPAADRAFLEEWQVETVERITYDLTSRQLQPVSADVPRKREKILVASKTYSREDWGAISTYSAFVKALHNSSLTQRIAVYLRLTHGVPYLDFYESLIEDAFPHEELTAGWHRAVSDHYRNYLVDAGASDHMEVQELPDLPYSLHPSRWIYVQACLNFDRFFGHLRADLCRRYPFATHLASVIDYQQQLVILPSYERRVGKTFRTDVDWMRYFEEARTRHGSQPLAVPDPLPGALVHMRDQVSGERRIDQSGAGAIGYFGEPLDWDEVDTNDRWERWITRTVIGRSSASLHNLQDFSISVGA